MAIGGIGGWSVSPTIDLEGVDLAAGERAIGAVIAEEVARERDRMRADYDQREAAQPGSATPAKFVGLLGELPPELRTHPVDSIPWDRILIEEPDALARAALRLKMSTTDVIAFARSYLLPANWEALFWFEHYLRATFSSPPSEGAQTAVIAALKQHEEAQKKHLRERSAAGGKASAATRKEQRDANAVMALAYRDKYRAQGDDERVIAGKVVRAMRAAGLTISESSVRSYLRQANKKS